MLLTTKRGPAQELRILIVPDFATHCVVGLNYQLWNRLRRLGSRRHDSRKTQKRETTHAFEYIRFTISHEKIFHSLLLIKLYNDKGFTPYDRLSQIHKLAFNSRDNEFPDASSLRHFQPRRVSLLLTIFFLVEFNLIYFCLSLYLAIPSLRVC